MRCSSCGHESPHGAKFCSECGSALRSGLTCPSCGTTNLEGGKFCRECGHPLATVPSPTPPPAPALPASFAAGRYRVRRFLGEGGKKRVYLAHDTRLDREVALALIRTEGLDETSLARVRREAQAMGRLGDHPHIVTVYDVGDEQGRPYIVSQYMAGGDLAGFLERAEGHRVPPDRALRVADQVCQALEHAHGRGIIHRDLKPGNVWLTAEGTAKLGDFGLAVSLDRSRLTMAGMMVGTVAYMPPEQALGKPPDARSDLYALGAMLYEMVTGRPPFLGDGIVAIISQHINTAPVAPAWHNPEIPRALEALILRLLSKTPEERPESATAVRRALEAIAATASVTAERVAQEGANPLDRLAGGVFVGRERELDELRAGLEDALSGHGRLLCLVGEPGIGKTRTAEELATYARLRSAQVLWGRCYEGEGAPAYWPWVQIVRDYVHDRDPKALLSEMGSGAADIAQVISEVRDRLPGLPAPPALAPEQARFRLFDSLTTFLKNAGRTQPLVLILDNLHWADKPSLLLLQFLARELRGARLLVVGTYRDIELGRQHPLAETLAELAREQLSQRILLRGLAARDVARFIELAAGVKPSERLVAAVYGETEGNPFFVNEIVHLLVADGHLERLGEVATWTLAIPQGVREVIGRRLNHLSDACNRLLTVASVIGREFTLDSLARVAGVSGDRLLEALEEAVGARVLTEVPGTASRFRFGHALIRQTLYEELSAPRRVRLHRQVGEALEALYGAKPEPHLAELAHHFFQAAPGGDVDKAIEYARRAGDRALALFAYEEAARHYEMALQALELQASVDERRQCDLLVALGEAQMRAGDPPAARDVLERAAGIAKRLGLPEPLARAALGFAHASPDPGVVDARHITLLEDALSVLPDEDSLLRARVLTRLSYALAYSSQERHEAISQEGVEMARRVGDPSTLAYALGSQHGTIWEPEHLDDRLAIAAEIVQLAEAAGDRETALRGYRFRCIDLLELGDVAAADAALDTYARRAEEFRQPAYFWLTPMFRATRALMEGRFAEAERLTDEGAAIGKRVQRIAVQLIGTQMFTLRREQARLGELEATIKSFADEYPTVPAWRVDLAVLHSELGRREEARAEFECLAASGFTVLRRWWRLGALCRLAEVCTDLREARHAAALYDLLLPHASHNVIFAGGMACFGSAARYLGLLATTLARWDEAQAHFEAALRFNAKTGARPWVAHTEHDSAAMLLARGQPGDREKALGLLNRALGTAQELGMTRLVDRALALKVRAQGLASTDAKTSIDAVASAVERDKPDLRPHAAPDGTVTLMFSDMEGFTRMTERLGDQAAHKVIQAHNAIVRQQAAAHGGFEVELQGDGFLLAFASARRALRCAIAIQRAFAAYSQQHPEQPIRVRIGLHTGEAIREAERFFGKAVILAARIAAQAGGGEILVSALVKQLTESAGEFRFDAGREAALKGLAGTHRLFGVRWE